jgi:4a-hydroxytetrahydrobiopterin dehydratase
MNVSEEGSIDLASRHCAPCEEGTPPLSREEVGRMMGQLEGWEAVDGRIEREFRFKNYYQTMAFVNAVAWIANRENHHPHMQVGYNTCRVGYTTHAIGGLSENDFISAAKVEALLSD